MKKLFLKQAPILSKNHILIVDSNLLKVPVFKRWLKKQSWVIPVKAGENLKTLNSLESVILKLSELSNRVSKSEMILVSVGGGSVSDFTGFLASIYKRGVKLEHIPTTWLAAMDSSHGGKTALNIKSLKNQIGSFYPADQVYLIKEFLETQALERQIEARGEVLKTAILSSPKLLKEVSDSRVELWKLLPKLISVKERIVKQDPFETKDIRQLLNLGHTTAHLLELKSKLPHGIAVWQGLLVNAEDSYRKGFLKTQQYLKIQKLLSFERPKFKRLKIKKQEARMILLNDKKTSALGYLNEPYIFGVGRVNMVNVPVEDILKSMERLGLVEFI